MTDAPAGTDRSPFLDESEILADLADASTEELEEFWARVHAVGTPLVDDDSLRVTFLYRLRPTEAVGAVYLFANRVTDKAAVDSGMLAHVPGTDIWVRTLELPATRRMSYGFLELPEGERPAPGPPPLRQGGLRVDPANPLPPVSLRSGGFGLSLFRGWLAPPQPHWESRGPATGPLLGTVHSASLEFPSADGPVEKPCHAYLPPTESVLDRGAPVALVTLFDGEKWFGGNDLPSALDHAIASGDLPPIAVVAVSSLDVADRMWSLGTNLEVIDAVAGELLPWVGRLAEEAGVSLAPRGHRDRLLAGESLGGLSALLAALDRPGEWGTVLAQSPSLWRAPGALGSPRDLGAREGGDWITERFRRTPLPEGAARVLLTVGSREGASIPRLHQLHHALGALGWDARISVYDGGHDDACWRGELFAALGEHTGAAGAADRPTQGDRR